MKRKLTKKGKLFFKICLIIIILIILFMLYWFRNPFVNEMTIEAGTQITLNDLIKDEKARNPELISTIDKNIINKVGTHIVEAKGNNRNFKIKINVKDTVDPEVIVKEYHYFIGDEFNANNFIKEVNDHTSVTGKMIDQIDLSKNGSYDVNVSFSDEGNNMVSSKAKLIVEKDVVAPVIKAEDIININKGDKVLYKQVISVTDNRDGEITDFTIDNTKVNLTRVGIYPVTIKATDYNKNTSEKTINIKVNLKDKSEAKTEARTYAKEIINNIIKKSMSKQQKLKAVYDFVKNYYKYEAVHDGTIDDYYVDALNGFVTKKGDCYVVNAMARVLLEELGFKTYGLELHGSDMKHISFMANTGDGWYHYCAFKKKSGIVIYKWTDDQMIKHYSFAGITSIPDHLPKTPLK